MNEVEREIRKDKLAARRAFVDQREKMFLDQYPMRPPIMNQMRLEDLEVWKFQLEMEAWEIDGCPTESKEES